MENLNKKWWFRLIIVFYVLIGLSGFAIVIIVTTSFVPKFSPYDSTFSYKCNDGYVGGTLKYGYSEAVTSNAYPVKEHSYFYLNNESGVSLVRAVCMNYKNIRDVSKEESLILGRSATRGEYYEYLPRENNFTLFAKDAKYNGTWSQTTLIGVIGLVILFFILYVVRYIFFFITTGKHRLIFNEDFFKKIIRKSSQL